MTSKDNPSDIFDAGYFAYGCGRPYQRDEEWLGFFATIAEYIATDIQPSTVLDAGCAMGFLVEALRNLGIEGWGVDISAYAIQQVHQEIKAYCWVGSVTDPLPQKYDLIVNIEVLEHLAPHDSVKAVQNLCRYTDDILFSSSPIDYKESTHFNVQPPEYWAELFAQNGFFRDVDFDARFITDWAARFKKEGQPQHRVIRSYERKFWSLWNENSQLREQAREHRDKITTLEDELKSMRADVYAKQEHIDFQHTQIESIYQSRSWRIIQAYAKAWARLTGPGKSSQ